MWVKICGVTRTEDVAAVRAAGADAIGFNLVPASLRFVARERLGQLLAAARGLERVLVVADEPEDELRRLRDDFAFERLQLHGDEPPELLARLGAHCFKALRLRDARDVEAAKGYPSQPLLVDAHVPGKLGGTGKLLDTELVRELCGLRPVVLAGGLTSDNVSARVRVVRPWGVDVASGVESEPGVKDPERVAAFVHRAREAG